MSEDQQSPWCQIDVIVEDPSWHGQIPEIEEATQRLCRACLAMAPLSKGIKGPLELCVVLADDDRLRQMNYQYRGLDRSTNVLSFANLDGDLMPEVPGPLMLGDVLISREATSREAAEQDKRFADHASHLIVHGTLHLLGYRHDEDEAAAEMEALERRVLGHFAVADPYRQRMKEQGQTVSEPSDQPFADSR